MNKPTPEQRTTLKANNLIMLNQVLTDLKMLLADIENDLILIGKLNLTFDTFDAFTGEKINSPEYMKKIRKLNDF